MSAVRELELPGKARFYAMRTPLYTVLVQDSSFKEEPAYWHVAKVLSADIVIKGRAAGDDLPEVGAYSVHVVYLTPSHKARSIVWAVESSADARSLMTFVKTAVQ